MGRGDRSRAGTRTITLAQLPSSGDAARPRRRYSRWRAATLIGVHVLVAAHIAHWYLAGRTLSPLELNEAMYTLELGIVTAGFILMALITISAAVFGRFFCSWGCHILALQDLCAWLLRKLGIRAKPVRSRTLLFVAPLAALYMFVWPRTKMAIEGRPAPALHLRDDAGGWASFMTDDFWRNLPGPGVALLTFSICGFAIVYFLGTRSFCQYACPYGAVFGLMDRLAPGRLRADPDKCTSCGVCTAVCESHVRVHEEIGRFGMVVDPLCLKDLDCVSACPEGALAWGWTRPSLLRSFRAGRKRLGYDFSLGEDLLMAAVMILSVAVFRGLYGLVPFLLSLAVGGIFAYIAVLALRLARSPNVRCNGFQLKRAGAITRAGWSFALFASMLLALTAHSGFIRYHAWTGQRALDRATAIYERNGDAALIAAEARAALGSFDLCERWGLFIAPGHHLRAASASWGAGDIPGAERHWRLAIEQEPENLKPRLDLAASLLQRGEHALAEPLLRQATDARARHGKDAAHIAEQRAAAWFMIGQLAAERGDHKEAMAAFAAAEAQMREHAPRAPAAGGASANR